MRSFYDAAWIGVGIAAGTVSCGVLTSGALAFETANVVSFASAAVFVLLAGSLNDPLGSLPAAQ